MAGSEREGAVTISKPNIDLRRRKEDRNSQVHLVILIEISGDDGRGLAAGVRISLKFGNFGHSSSAVAQEDGDRPNLRIGDGQVGESISIEVSDGRSKGKTNVLGFRGHEIATRIREWSGLSKAGSLNE